MELLEKILSINSNYIVIGLLVFFFTMEQITSNPFSFKKRGGHLFQNMLFQIILVLLNISVVVLQVYLIEWLNERRIGLLFLVELPIWVKLIFGVMLYDFTTYWIHIAAHKVPIMWRLHRVHHSDTSMDSSTTFRFHPLEMILVYEVGNVICAGVFGTDVLALGLYYFILNIFLFLEHSNLHYPNWLNKSLGLFFVTPDQHRVHHQQDQFYTDSNFADIFIIWDRIFGTYKTLPVEKMKYGLAEFEGTKKQGFLFLMISPFINIKRIKSDKT